jgi:hypothetical protein
MSEKSDRRYVRSYCLAAALFKPAVSSPGKNVGERVISEKFAKTISSEDVGHNLPDLMSFTAQTTQ